MIRRTTLSFGILYALICVECTIASAQNFGSRLSASVEANAFTSVFAHDTDFTNASLLEEGANLLQVNLSTDYAVTRTCRLGGGFGYRFYSGKMRVGAVDEGFFRQFRQQSLPLFFSAGLSNSQQSVSPYLRVKTGYNFETRSSGEDSRFKYDGFFADGSFGLQFGLAGLNLQIGLSLMLDTLNNSQTGTCQLIPSLGAEIGVGIRSLR